MKRFNFLIFFTILFITAFTNVIFGQSKTRVGQAEIVTFPKNGEVKIEVIETLKKPTKIVFTKTNNKKLASFTLKNANRYIPFQFESAVNPITRFRVLEIIEGLPQPLIQVVAINPGGSDHSFWNILFAEIDGKIKMLTPRTTENSIQGGVHFGKIGDDVGMAVYNFLWDEKEAHYADHHYKVDLYKFDDAKGLMVLNKSLTTKEKHKNKSEALKSLGFGYFQNRLNDWTVIKDFREDDSEYNESAIGFNYEAQMKFIPKELGKIYLGMPFAEFAKELDLTKAEVRDARFEWLEVSVPMTKGDIVKLTFRVQGLSNEEKKVILIEETVMKKDEFGNEYEVTVKHLKTENIPTEAFVYSIYIDFKEDSDLKSYSVKTFGNDGEVRKPSDQYHLFDIQWNKETADGSNWLIRSFHQGDKKTLQLLGRIANTEWALEN